MCHVGRQACCESLLAILLGFPDVPRQARILGDLVSLAGQMIQDLPDPVKQRFVLCVDVGRRYALLALLMELLQKEFPKRPVFVVQCTSTDLQKQSQRVLPTFKVVCLGEDC